MALVMRDGKFLMVGGAFVTNTDCCCEEPPPIECGGCEGETAPPELMLEIDASGATENPNWGCNGCGGEPDCPPGCGCEGCDSLSGTVSLEYDEEESGESCCVWTGLGTPPGYGLPCGGTLSEYGEIAHTWELTICEVAGNWIATLAVYDWGSYPVYSWVKNLGSTAPDCTALEIEFTGTDWVPNEFMGVLLSSCDFSTTTINLSVAA